MHSILTYIKKHNMLAPGDKVMVGVSGGPDSLALLHYLAEHEEALGISLVAVHLHHGFRGEEADEDERAAQQYASCWGIPFYSKKVNVPELIRQENLSPQVAARHARYAFFAEVGREVQATKLALAHHRDDQAETVLLRMLRGAGSEGLSGMWPTRTEGSLQIIRPFLEVDKEDLIRYCLREDINFREDSSNRSRKYARNEVRLDMIPFLKQYNPHITEALSRLAEWTREEQNYLHALTREALSELTLRTDYGFSLDRTVFLTAPIALQRRIVKLILNCLSVRGLENEGRAIEGLREWIAGEVPHRRIHIKSDVWFLREYDQIEFRVGEPRASNAYTYELHLPGLQYVPEWPGTISVQYDDHPPATSTSLWCAVFDRAFF